MPAIGTAAQPFGLTRVSRSMQQFDVIVIGGGAAGIGAARSLADAGREVLLVEADTRLGGRARTEHVDGLALDLGAGWLHSAEHNPWVEIAALHGFELDRPAALARAVARTRLFPSGTARGRQGV